MKKMLIIICLLLVSCTTEVSTNNFYQTNYNSNCIKNGTTWSELVLCQKKDLDSEHVQNDLTNSLLNQ